jgi:hypothetical protein
MVYMQADRTISYRCAAAGRPTHELLRSPFTIDKIESLEPSRPEHPQDFCPGGVAARRSTRPPRSA